MRKSQFGQNLKKKDFLTLITFKFSNDFDFRVVYNYMI